MPRTQDNANATADAERGARQFIGPWWKYADRHPHYPASDEDLVEIFDALEFEFSAETIREFIDKRYIPAPREWRGRPAWSALDIMAMHAALEFRRRWRKGSALHHHKKTPFELGQEIAEAKGIADGVFHDIDNYTVEDLLLLMVKADDVRMREAIHVALKIKLRNADAAD